MEEWKRILAKYQVRIDARKRHKLLHAQIRMAPELGVNPKKCGSLDNHPQERWRLPSGQFIEKCYLTRSDPHSLMVA